MFSIIIPTYNAAIQLEATLQSVISQSRQEYEILIIDNCSADHTPDVAIHFRNLTQCPVHLLSSPDKGIYDAQNKGVLHATYPWLIFLGAGDRLHNPDVLAMLATKLDSMDGIIYGNVNRFSEKHPGYNQIQYPPSRISKATMLRSRGICQQAIIAHKDVFKLVCFSANYRIAGDFDWILNCVEHKLRFTCINEIISDYCTDGISSTNTPQLHSELKSIVNKHYPYLLSFLYSGFLDLSLLKHKLIKSFLHA